MSTTEREDGGRLKAEYQRVAYYNGQQTKDHKAYQEKANTSTAITIIARLSLISHSLENQHSNSTFQKLLNKSLLRLPVSYSLVLRV